MGRGRCSRELPPCPVLGDPGQPPQPPGSCNFPSGFPPKGFQPPILPSSPSLLPAPCHPHSELGLCTGPKEEGRQAPCPLHGQQSPNTEWTECFRAQSSHPAQGSPSPSPGRPPVSPAPSAQHPCRLGCTVPGGGSLALRS